MPDSFPFCDAGIDAFVNRFKQQADETARATSDAVTTDARAIPEMLPGLAPVPQHMVARLHGWRSGMGELPRTRHQNLRTALMDNPFGQSP